MGSGNGNDAPCDRACSTSASYQEGGQGRARVGQVVAIEGAARVLGDQQSVVHLLPCTRISVSPRREDSLVRPHWLPRTSAGATRNRSTGLGIAIRL